MKRLSLQPGLGDAIHALPFICEMVKHEEVEFYTKWPEVFQKVKGVNIFKNPLAIRLGDIRFQWTNVSRKSFVQMYEINSGVKPDFNAARLALAFGLTGQLLELFNQVKASGKDLCILGMPRAAGRHKERGDFSCASLPIEFATWMIQNRDKYFYVAVGKTENYLDDKFDVDSDLNDKLSVQELITLISCAEVVASQESALTVIGCLFDIKLKVFKAALQTEEEHREHVRRTIFDLELLIE